MKTCHARTGIISLIAMCWVMVIAPPTLGAEPEVDAEKMIVQRPLWEPINKWDRKAEEEFAAFVEQLGTVRARFGCVKLHHCLQKPEANMLWSEEDRTLKVFSDCADVPYTLRAYFAYKTKRPFQWMRTIRGGRYKIGNKPRTFANFLAPDLRDVRHFLARVSMYVHSGFYRMHGNVEDTDTYAVDVHRKSVRPGTVYYDPKGHVLIVYKVEDNGVVRLLDGHPDNTLTRARFGDKFARGSARLGGGFRNWRWYRLEKDDDERYRFVRETNAEIHARGGDHSETAQYKKSYKVEEYRLNYFAWVRAKLSKNGMRIKPVEEFTELVESLCSDVKDRVHAVQIALDAGLHKKAQPAALPDNIYGTSGEWEIYSTPSRDARLKAAVREIHRFVIESLQMAEAGDRRLVFDGDERRLLKELTVNWERLQTVDSCQFSYRNSQGNSVALSIADVLDRLFVLSFDPYHCPELRWGAVPGTPEYTTCPRNATKVRWYENEQKLRNRIERIYGKPTGLDFGPATSPQIHVGLQLAELAAKLHQKAASAAPLIAGSGWAVPPVEGTLPAKECANDAPKPGLQVENP
jgi:hypothetical protein